MNPSFEALLPKMQELKDLFGIIGLATWDQETHLPPKANAARGHQLSTLQALYHEKLVAPALGELLAAAAQEQLGEDEQAMVWVLKRERDRELRVPERLVRDLAEAQSRALEAWREARSAKRFAVFGPALKKLLALRLEQAEAMGYAAERYDALLETHEPGMTVERLEPVIARLKARLVSILDTLMGSKRAPRPNPFQGRTFEVDRQWRLTLSVLGQMGFDLDAGRQDKSIHPFTNGTHPTDVRLTTRLDPSNFLSGLFSSLHEGGHGLYEQGFTEAHHRTPLAAAPSMGLHESQSRLWENLVGRSQAFWRHQLPVLQQMFPGQLEGASVDDVYAAVNQVSPSLIRVDADEVTYNLHIVLRFELELLLARGQLPVDELPGEWSARCQALLGRTPAHDTEGVLQDIHWAWGELGYFPTYALGNLYAASIFKTASRELPGLQEDVAQGRLLPLRSWLGEKVHAQGFRHGAEELVRRVTGTGLTDEDFIAYLKAKYGPLYEVTFREE